MFARRMTVQERLTRQSKNIPKFTLGTGNEGSVEGVDAFSPRQNLQSQLRGNY